MKKLLFTAAFAVLGLGLTNAQEDDDKKGFAKGDFYMSGAIGYASEKTGDVKANTFEFSPSAGYFVSENIAVGVSVGIMTGKNEEPGLLDVDTTQLNAGVFGRYYFTPGKAFSLFGHLEADYVNAKVEQGPLESKADGFAFGFAPGISYFVSNNFALEASVGVLGYSSTKPDVSGAESTDNFRIGVDMSDINLGLIYKF
jgi:outer membrane protein